ncbi:UNVERIFIED_CONTAM: hypothetical protein K2H54_036030 [Gekko kuhli]
MAHHILASVTDLSDCNETVTVHSDISSELALNPSPDDPSLILSNEGYRFCDEQMIYIAKPLNNKAMCTDQKPKDPFRRKLYCDSAGSIAFPVLEGFLDISGAIWDKAASISASSRKTEDMYEVQQV